MTTISRPRQSQIAIAYRAGLTAAPQKHNPYADRDGMMPERIATVLGAQWHAYEAGRLRASGSIASAATMLRNARFCMRRATALQRA